MALTNKPMLDKAGHRSREPLSLRRDGATRDSESEHGAGSPTGEHDSFADYERPDGVAALGAAAARDSPQSPPQSPFGGPAPAGVSSGLAGLGQLYI